VGQIQHPQTESYKKPLWEKGILDVEAELLGKKEKMFQGKKVNMSAKMEKNRQGERVD